MLTAAAAKPCKRHEGNARSSQADEEIFNHGSRFMTDAGAWARPTDLALTPPQALSCNQRHCAPGGKAV
jgi:hypothetical protein